MGEQQSGGASPGRRRVHPDGTAAARGTGPAVVFDDAELEALLAAAVLRGHRPDAEAEQRAVAAFRAARAAGAHRARTRRRDDWRPREQRRLGRSLKTVLSLFAASLALGGVAFAAIGSSDAPDTSADDRGSTAPAAGTPDRPAAERSAGGPAAGKPGHPSTAQDIEAKCRAHDRVEGRGDALDATAWQGLVAAAGGAHKVDAYCAEQLARAAQTGADRKKADASGAPRSPQDPSGENASGTGAEKNTQNSSENGSEGSAQDGSGRSAENSSGKNAGKKD